MLLFFLMSIEVEYSDNNIPLIIIKTETINETKNITKYKNTLVKLGSGECSEVYLFELENGDKIAGKIIKKGDIENKNEQGLKDKINLQKSFNRPDIVKVIDYFENNNYIFIFLEYCKNLSLKDLINKRGK